MDKNYIKKLIKVSLEEDVDKGDITSESLIDRRCVSRANLVFKEPGILCGLGLACQVFHKIDPNLIFHSLLKDGVDVKANTTVATVKGKTLSLLTAERVALNFLGYLSGIATHTDKFVKKVARYNTAILDTRKTTPGMRKLEKYAVKCGGGTSHRFNLHEFVLIKDNHLLACQKRLSITEAIKKIRRKTKKLIEVEVENLKEFQEALEAQPEIILLDNMSTEEIQKAVAMARNLPKNKRPLLEASGGVNLKNVLPIARTGVDRISIGLLTHSQKNINVSMELEE